MSAPFFVVTVALATLLVMACNDDRLVTDVETPRDHVAGDAPSAEPSFRQRYIRSVQESADDSFGFSEREGEALAMNDVQGTSVRIAGDEVVVTELSELGATMTMRWVGLGRGPSIAPVPSVGVLEIRDRRAVLTRGDAEEWYLDGPLGLEQGFTLTERSDGVGELKLVLSLQGLVARVAEAGDVIEIHDELGDVQALYSDLFVEDADGDLLASHLETQGADIVLSIDDAEATYPLFVDPLLAMHEADLALPAGYSALSTGFGKPVSIDGDTAVIGSPTWSSNRGAAHVYVRAGSTWSFQQTLLPSDPATGAYFGWSVSVDGDAVVIGARGATTGGISKGAGYVFRRSGSAWTQEAKLVPAASLAGDRVGSSAALAGDTVVLGASAGGAGAAYVHVRVGGIWAEQATLLASDGAAGDAFGSGVALSGDTAVIAAPGNEAVYAWVRSGSTWSEQAKLAAGTGGFGASVDIDGSSIIVGAPSHSVSGTAHVFLRTGTTWAEEAQLTWNGLSNGPEAPRFGYSVSIDGDTATVGAPYGCLNGSGQGGCVYVFGRSPTWSGQSKYQATSSSSSIGWTVALDGDTAITTGERPERNAVFRIRSELGDTCSVAADCWSGFCVDGLCCNEACGSGSADDCLACSVAAGGPANGVCSVRSAQSVCRAATTDCDVEELCSGVAPDCPSDAFIAAGASCGSAPVEACDAQDTCAGDSALCTPVVLAAGIDCRPAAGPCDVPEQCDGIAPACPSDALAPDGTVCSDDDICTDDDACDAAGECVSATSLDCDDDNDCTIDSCGKLGCAYVEERLGAPCETERGVPGGCDGRGACVEAGSGEGGTGGLGGSGGGPDGGGGESSSAGGPGANLDDSGDGGGCSCRIAATERVPTETACALLLGLIAAVAGRSRRAAR